MTKVRVQAQYFENYGSVESPHFKPKSGQEFEFDADDSILMYDKEGAIEAIKACLEAKCDGHNKYKYVGHELVFRETMPLKGFRAAYDEIRAGADILNN